MNLKWLRREKQKTLIAFTEKGKPPTYAYVEEPAELYLLEELSLMELFTTPLPGETVHYINVYDQDEKAQIFHRRKS